MVKKAEYIKKIRLAIFTMSIFLSCLFFNTLAWIGGELIAVICCVVLTFLIYKVKNAKLKRYERSAKAKDIMQVYSILEADNDLYEETVCIRNYILNKRRSEEKEKKSVRVKREKENILAWEACLEVEFNSYKFCSLFFGFCSGAATIILTSDVLKVYVKNNIFYLIVIFWGTLCFILGLIGLTLYELPKLFFIKKIVKDMKENH